MKIKSNDKTVSKKQGVANIGYSTLQDIRELSMQMRELKAYVPKDKQWIIDLKIDAIIKDIRNMQDVIHTLSNIQPMRHQL